VVVEKKEESKVVSKGVVHGAVRCDGCNAYPLVGVRYKCSICEDFDFCE